MYEGYGTRGRYEGRIGRTGGLGGMRAMGPMGRGGADEWEDG